MPTLESGQTFERYRILRFLGSGVSGESYEAEDSMLLRRVTLKLIHPASPLPDSSRRQFFREMQGISVLYHPYLAAILDYGEIHGSLYVARRFVSSGSLLGVEGRLWFRPPLGVSDAIHYTAQLAQALQSIHARGLIHGAITFSNIMVLRGPNLDNEQSSSPFLLTDVGLANFVRRFGQQQPSPLPVTAAPEQLARRVTPASDQFALAVLLYFWLTSRPPYLGSPEEIEYLKLTETITPASLLNARVSSEQDGIILRALSVSPEDRYASISAFADALMHSLASTLPVIPVTEPGLPVEITLHSSTSTPQQAAKTAQELNGSHPSSSASDPVTTVETAPAFESIPQTDPALEFVSLTPQAESEVFPAHPEEQSLSTEENTSTEISADSGDQSAPVESESPAQALLAVASQSEPAPETPRPDSEPETQPTPTEPQPAPETEPETQPGTEPEQPSSPVEPLPQTIPDVPQPFPEPEVPPAIPEPATEPQREPAQPAPEPLTQPIPDVPQPIPGSETPPVSPSPLAEGNGTETLTGRQELQAVMQSLTAARVIITSPYTDTPYEVQLEQEEITIGRAGASDILLDRDNLTSRHHALLKREGMQYVLYDRRSANGVYVNGQKISSGESGYMLLDGDHISIGNYELIFRSGPPVEAENAQETTLAPNVEITHLI